MDINFSLSSEEIEMLATSAGKAPSGGNAQPWKIIFNQCKADIFLNEERTSGLLDPNNFASMIGLGAFVENLLITANSLGLEYQYSQHKFHSPNAPIASITFISRNGDKTLYKEFSNLIENRVTNRQLYDGSILSEETIAQLRSKDVMFDHNYSLYTLCNVSDKEKVADTLGKADMIRVLNDQLFF